MSEWVNLDVIEGVGPVAVKRRRPREDETLLDHEAAVLAAVDHPGVVRLVERRASPDPALVTHFVATHSLATCARPDVDATIEMVASITATLAALHRQGVRHGAIGPSHVLIGPGGRPVLCGLSRATLPGTPVDESPTPADDVAAVGRVLTGLLTGHDDLEPIPARRSIRHRAWAGYRPRALLTLADHCQADDPQVRPSAASLAATIEELARPAPRHGARSAWLRDRVRTVPARLRARLWGWAHPVPGRLTVRRGIVAALAVTGMIAGGLAWRTQRTGPSPASAATDRSDDDGAGRPPSSSADRPPSTSVPSGRPGAVPEVATPPSTVGGPPEPACSGVPPSGVDTDGDGCADGTAVVDGQSVIVDGDRFRLGRSDDRVLVGDWDCDGLSTAVLVRSDPPALWHFPDWSQPGETITAELVDDKVVPASVTQERSVDGCDVLMAQNSQTGRTAVHSVSG